MLELPDSRSQFTVHGPQFAVHCSLSPNPYSLFPHPLPLAIPQFPSYHRSTASFPIPISFVILVLGAKMASSRGAVKVLDA